LGIRRFLPYLAGLLILAFALGSLPRSTPGGSIFFNSYWLLYIIYLAPFAVLGTMVGLIILIALNWRELGTRIGLGLVGRRTVGRKKRNRSYILVQAAFWAIAIAILVQRQVSASGSSLSGAVTGQIQNDPTGRSNPFLGGGVLPAVSNLVQSIWFAAAFLALLVVGGLVLVQSARVAARGSQSMYPELEEKQLEGLKTVYQAMKLVDDTASDPRSRIISCYQHMLGTVSRIGVPVSSDQTARELEKAIRSTFLLKGPATSDLTRLFEEARYSLHEIVDDDAMKAHQDLESIAAELKVQMKDWA
jgi:Domain of unknown function (DUF4129)